MPLPLRFPPSRRPLVSPALLRPALLMACLGLTGAAQANPEALRLRALAATCANCHGTDGRAIEGSEVPGLAGQSAPYLAGLLRAYRSGERPATVMHQLAKGYTDSQIDALAAYFAARPR